MALDKLTSDMITAGAVNAAAIADGTVVAAEIADDAIVTAKLADDAVTNANTISEDITFAANTNGISAGPISIASGNFVAVSSGTTWSII